MPKAQHKAGQNRQRGAAGLAEPAFDLNAVDLGLIFGLAPVEPMADQPVPLAAVWTAGRTREDNPSEMCNVILDRTAKILYDGHLFGKPDLQDVAAKLDPVGRAVPFLRMERLAYPTLPRLPNSPARCAAPYGGWLPPAPPPDGNYLSRNNLNRDQRNRTLTPCRK